MGAKISFAVKNTVFVGTDIKDAQAGGYQNQMGNTEIIVSLTMTDEGKEKFAKATQRAIDKGGETLGIYYDGEWIDPTSNWLYEDLKFSITFYEDGKYYGKGFFGTGNGTYKTKGNTITTYVDGEIYLTYEVKSLNTTNAEVTMFDNSGDSMQLRLRKK